MSNGTSRIETDSVVCTFWQVCTYIVLVAKENKGVDFQNWNWTPVVSLFFSCSYNNWVRLRCVVGVDATVSHHPLSAESYPARRPRMRHVPV